MAKTIQILEPFKPLIQGENTYYVFASGRGVGKSHSVAQCLIIKACMQTLRILCIREVQNSIQESVKSLLEQMIIDMELQDKFEVTRDEIRCVNGSKFIFRGMRDSNAVNIKSIADIDVTWLEEGEGFSQVSWNLLVPSVIRSRKPEIVITFNPRFADDVVYKTFFLQKPPPRSYVRFLTQEDNPFFKGSNLEVQMNHDREVMTPSMFSWVWLGQLMDNADECIFNKQAFELMTPKVELFERGDYYRVVVGCDPASTSKSHSNEYGIVVVGAHSNGEFHMLGNYTDKHTPFSFAQKISQLYDQFDCDAVVAEVNQGGDFIKSTLLTHNPHLNVLEVRASRDKVHRASPVANMAALGKIKLFEEGKEALIAQMRKTTTMGYMGAKGESPDGLDAFVWAVYELAGLTEKDEEDTLFNLSYFSSNKRFGFGQSYTSLFVGISVKHAILLEFERVENEELEYAYSISNCYTCLSTRLVNFIKELNREFESIYIPDIEGYYDLDLENLIFYEPSADKIDNLVLSALEKLKSGMFILKDKMNTQTFETFRGEILKIALSRFKLEAKKDDLIIRTLCNLTKEVI